MNQNSKKLLLTLTTAAFFTSLGTGCDDGASPTCYQIIEDYQDCMDEFCSVEGAGTQFCGCWIQGYGVSSAACECQGTTSWIHNARGLCDTMGPAEYSELIDCSAGVAHARGWIDDCG